MNDDEIRKIETWNDYYAYMNKLREEEMSGRSIRPEDYGFAIESRTDPYESRYEVAGREDHGYIQGVRAGDADRQKVISHLRQAHADGRLTADQFHARSDAAVKAETQKELTGIARDLPAPPDENEHRLVEWADALKEVESKHTGLFHGTAQFAILTWMLVASIPFLVIPQNLVGNSPWLVLPILSYIAGTLLTIGNIVFWVDG